MRTAAALEATIPGKELTAPPGCLHTNTELEHRRRPEESNVRGPRVMIVPVQNPSDKRSSRRIHPVALDGDSLSELTRHGSTMDATKPDTATATVLLISPATRTLYFLLGNLLPSLGLLLMLRGTPLPASWQSGEFHDYVTFLLSARAAALFYPFFFYAIACFTLGLFRPDLARRRFWVRLGIYSGILLAVQYCFIVGIVLLQVKQLGSWQGFLAVVLWIPLAGLALVVLPWLGWLMLRALTRYLERKGQVVWVIFLMFAGPFLALLFGLPPGLGDADDWAFAVAVFPGSLAVVASPAWMAAAFSGLAWRVSPSQGKHLQLGLSKLLGLLSWLTAYMAAWRFAVVETLEAYAALPTSPPGTCYVASAAAQGHPRIVKSWSLRCTGGTHRRVNMQLAYLKCGELLLQTTSPWLHRCVRTVYDRVGPLLAARLDRPLSADVAYICLKPVEWTVRATIVSLVPEAAKTARRLYR